MAPRVAAPARQPGECDDRRPDRDRGAAPGERGVDEPYYFPADDGPIDYAAPQGFRRKGDLLIAELKRRRGAPASTMGVLALGDGTGLEINALPGELAKGGSPLGGPGASAVTYAILQRPVRRDCSI